jgi:hypothetical protein
MSVTFRLTDEETQQAREIARGRQAENAHNKRTTYKVDPGKSDLCVHAWGAFAEVGVAKVEGSAIRCVVHGPEDGFMENTEGPDVGEWEIKATPHRLGRLIVPAHLTHKHKPHQKYLLVRCDPPYGNIVGWAYGHEFIEWDDCLIGEGLGASEFDKRLPVRAYVARELHDFEATFERLARAGM